MKTIVIVLSLAVFTAAREMQATVKMVPHDRANNVTGTLKLMQSEVNGPVQITGRLMGLKPGSHGFHVHEKGDLSNGCISTGSHFNPMNKSHGGPHDSMRHVGDLGNVEANGQGIADVNIMDSVISLSGANNVLGRAFVVHSDVDDLGKGGHPLSATTGNAGSRLACGVVGVLSPVGSWNSGNSRFNTDSSLALFTLTISFYLVQLLTTV